MENDGIWIQTVLSLVLKQKISIIKTEDISNDIEKRFDTSNYKFNRPLPTGKNKKSDRIDER